MPTYTAAGGRSGQWMIVALSAIAAIFLLEIGTTTVLIARSEQNVQDLSENALTSIEQVARIRRDVDQERILLDDHIFASEGLAMAPIERQLSHVEQDLDDALRTYGPIANLPNEGEAWAVAQRDLTQFRQQVNATLALSRQNRDVEARASTARLIDSYDDLEKRMLELIRINRRGVTRAIEKISSVRQTAVLVVIVTGVMGLVGLLLIGRKGVVQLASYEGQLVRSLEALSERNRELDAFAGRIAHDLRAPLNVISLATQMWAQQPAVNHAWADRVQNGIKRLDAMIEDLLALSRLSAPAEAAVSDPALVGAQLAAEFRERFGDEAVLKEAIDPADVPYPEGLLRQALWNLLENAVKYRRPGTVPEVSIVGKSEEGRYVLRVADNGLGMSEDEIRRLFEPFFRAQRASGVSGTGLGLSIVKRIVESRGGMVTATSELGQGTIFVLQLPLARTSQALESRPSV